MVDILVRPDNAVESDSSYFWTEGDIVFILNKTTDLHTHENAKENVVLTSNVAGDKLMSLLIDMTPIKSLERGAREEYAKAGAAKKYKAIALVTKSKLSNIIANFFIGFNKPKAPTKLFDNYQEAINWLKEQAG